MAVLIAPRAAGRRRRRLRAPATSASRSTSARPGRSTRSPTCPGVEVGHATLVEGDARAHRRHRRAAARQGRRGTRPVLRGHLLAERQRRDDGHRVGRGVGDARGPGPHHQHELGGRGARRGDRLRRAPLAARSAEPWSLPVVAETWDGRLNDIDGMHVKAEHAVAGHRRARPAGPVAEGNVGGGTGMVCLRVQGRHRHRLARARGGRRRLHGRRARAGQLRPAPPAAHRRTARGPGDARQPRSTRRRRRARSSSWSRPTPRCCRTS